MDTFAALTGDLVRSTPLSQEDMRRARKTLSQALDDIEDGNWPSSRRRFVRGKPEFFRGDAWQCLLTNPSYALRAAIYVRTSMLVREDIDTRISIGIGPVDSVARSNVTLSRGDAFTLSGHGLDDNMGSRFHLSISVSRHLDTAFGGWLDSIARLCDSVIVQWEGRQLEVARLLCLYPGISQAEIGQRLKPAVSQQAVGKTMRSAGCYGLLDALGRFEEEDWSQP